MAEAGSKSLTVREAALADAACIAALAGQLSYPSTPEDVVQRLRGLPQDGTHAVFVAEDGAGRVVGWAHVFVYRPLEHDAVAEIAGLVVDENCRGAGAGKLLMVAVEHWALGKGLPAVVLRSNVIRDAAHQFYESLGYTRIKTQHAFRKIL
ncbi:MAG: GNAT family N-acetyltransferase [Acidobacteria bacterium]|nr:GNAT family N-acetyltransferase [Acidobacteriota bacterium]